DDDHLRLHHGVERVCLRADVHLAHGDADPHGRPVYVHRTVGGAVALSDGGGARGHRAGRDPVHVRRAASRPRPGAGLREVVPPAVVYVSNADSREIHVLSLDGGTGAVSLVQRMPVPGAVMPLAVSPSRRFLYASLRSHPFAVATLAIDAAAGTLTLLATAPLPDNTAYLSTDKTGRF